MPTGEMWQMDLNSDTNTGFGSGSAIGMATHEIPQANGHCPLNHIHGYSHLSAVSTATSESSAPNFVYQRKRLPERSTRCDNIQQVQQRRKSPAPLPWSQVPVASTSPDVINFVYERRKNLRGAATNFSTVVSAHNSLDRACTSAIRSQTPSVASADKTGGSQETEGTRASSLSAVVSNKLLPLTAPGKADGCLVEDRGFHAKDKMSKTIELHSVDDSCSSSMLDMDIGSGPLKSDMDDTDECSSSGVLVTDLTGDHMSLSTRDLCISILRSHGLLSGFRSNRSGVSEDDAPSCSSSSCSRSCNVCGRNGTAEDMLICDECEEAFHISCFNPSIRKMPIDEWYCQSCFKKKHKVIKERALRKSSIIRTEKGSATSDGDLSPIVLMLKDTEPYTTGVRVGKGFQAIVPEWSGPITDDSDVFPEPLEMDPSDFIPSLGVSSKPRRSSFIGNWLQCKEVIVGMGEDINGTICGKWRRAPLFEVQTDNWDCFCSILWDPIHADCAVPQELETEEVLKQLKYIEMLRPRLSAKRRKLETSKDDGSPVRIEDASNCTDSTNVPRDF